MICRTAVAPFRCPTLPESIAATLALLPRGRAWGADAGQPETSSIIYQFFAALGAVRNYLEQRLCALRLEFWCATHTETHDQWMREYGLPDACDPFPDLCTKVAAIGGTRCEYYAEIAARAGWTISCDEIGCFGPRIGGNGALAGRMRLGSAPGGPQLQVFVDLLSSIAFTGTRAAKPLIGRMLLGRSLGCGPDLHGLECLMGRVVHAEIQILYVPTA